MKEGSPDDDHSTKLSEAVGGRRCGAFSGTVLNVNDRYRRESDGTDFDNGILFEGDQGRIFVNRGRLSGTAIENLTESENRELEELISKLYKGKRPGNPMRNFFECLETSR